ncbi:endo-1,4-beta-xylanase C-like [Gigantopelta aegis]|uniref:endo-1,4-beta-xylanase C-like n=1 Tax=Gigantopelta aegis TaxID=1735272 RepID=UPI001B88A248|nr:endo-1,4-beta-xylanase C-like [Gigantopelta aegis]
MACFQITLICGLALLLGIVFSTSAQDPQQERVTVTNTRPNTTTTGQYPYYGPPCRWGRCWHHRGWGPPWASHRRGWGPPWAWNRGQNQGSSQNDGSQTPEGSPQGRRWGPPWAWQGRRWGPPWAWNQDRWGQNDGSSQNEGSQLPQGSDLGPEWGPPQRWGPPEGWGQGVELSNPEESNQSAGWGPRPWGWGRGRGIGPGWGWRHPGWRWGHEWKWVPGQGWSHVGAPTPTDSPANSDPTTPMYNNQLNSLEGGFERQQ